MPIYLFPIILFDVKVPPIQNLFKIKAGKFSDIGESVKSGEARYKFIFRSRENGKSEPITFKSKYFEKIFVYALYFSKE